MTFKCIQCGWCCKANPLYDFREGLWKEGLSEEQAQLVQKQHDILKQNHGGCPMLIQEDMIYKCLVEETLNTKPSDCQSFPYSQPEHWCYQYMKKHVKDMEIEDGKLKVTTKTGDIFYFKGDTSTLT